MMSDLEDRTRAHFTPQWLRNASDNAKLRELQDLEHLCSYPTVEHAVVCGTGPSLGKDYQKLREKQEWDRKDKEKHTLIIANHSNLATLLFEHIQPDLVIVTDSGEPTYNRMKRDVLPHFKQDLRKAGTCFILPTHARPDLFRLLLDNKMPVYTFLSMLRTPEGDDFAKLYNDALFAIMDGNKEVLHTCILQAGSVSNAAVLLCNALKLLKKAPSLEHVSLSGVDYSYPNGITRCKQVVWNAEVRDWDVDEYPTFLGEEIRRIKYNRMETSEEQMAYYRDLRFIYWNLVEQVKDVDRIFEMSTTTDNFIADFLPVYPLC